MKPLGVIAPISWLLPLLMDIPGLSGPIKKFIQYNKDRVAIRKEVCFHGAICLAWLTLIPRTPLKHQIYSAGWSTPRKQVMTQFIKIRDGSGATVHSSLSLEVILPLRLSPISSTTSHAHPKYRPRSEKNSMHSTSLDRSPSSRISKRPPILTAWSTRRYGCILQSPADYRAWPRQKA